MSIALDKCGAVILAGGDSRRMGRCKALLTIEGKTMVERLREELGDFDPIYLAANSPIPGEGLIRVEDVYPHAGPLGGLHAALLATGREALFCVPCDLPNFTRRLPELLARSMPHWAQAVICRDQGLRLHPLCGIYRRSLLPQLEECLSQGRRRVMDLLDKVPYTALDVGQELPREVFFNMNTPQDYQTALERFRFVEKP